MNHNLSTCAWIQSMYGISNTTLYSNNPQIDAACENIYVGQVLCVDTATFSYPAYNETLYQVGSRISLNPSHFLASFRDFLHLGRPEYQVPYHQEIKHARPCHDML